MPLQSPIRGLRPGGRPRSTPAGSEASLVPKARPRRWRAASRPVPSLRAWAAPRRTSLTYAPHSLPHIPQALLAVAAACEGEGEYGDATRLFTQHAFFCYDTSQQAATPRQQAATPRHQAATSRATWLQPHVPAGCNPTCQQAATPRATSLQPHVPAACNPTCQQPATPRASRLQPMPGATACVRMPVRAGRQGHHVYLLRTLPAQGGKGIMPLNAVAEEGSFMMLFTGPDLLELARCIT